MANELATSTTPPPGVQGMAPDYGATLYSGGAYGLPSAGPMLIDPRRLLRRWRTVALVLTLAAVAAAGYLINAEKIYRATSLIELSVRRPRIMSQQGAVIDDASAAQQPTEIFNTRIERFKGRTLLLDALQRLDAAHPGAFYPLNRNAVDEASLQRLRDERLRRFEEALALTLVRRSRLIRVAFEHPDPALAAAACNAFMAAAEASAYTENRTTSDAAVAWLDAQSEIQRKDLLATENALLAFRQANNIDALESRRRTVEDALRAFNQELIDVESREIAARVLADRLANVELDPDQAGELPTEITSAEAIQAVLARWHAAIVERDALRATHTPKHPDVQKLDNLVTIHREQALQALDQAQKTARANHQLLARQAVELRQKKDEQAQLAVELEIKIVEHQMRHSALERTRDAADQAYRSVLTRIQEARIAADEDTATVKIVEPAVVAHRPVRPQPLPAVALAMLLGLVAGTGLVILCDHFEDRVTGPEDFQNRGPPILAVVPHAKVSDRPSIATTTIRHGNSEIGEAYAGLGAVLDAPRHKERSAVILVTSSIPGEGKTVTSCNLAATLANKGRRVLLLDFDIRRPRLAGIFPIPPGKPDLLAVLADPGLAYAGLAYPVPDCPNLDLIASRPATTTNAADTFGTAAVRNLLAWARSAYDHVVLDAPPLGLVSDTLALAPLVDLTLVMVRPETSRKRLTWHTIRRLQESGIHSLGLVVNDLDVSKILARAYSPYYHYQQHYKTYAPAESTTDR